MTRQVITNFTAPDGVGAIFPGGLRIPASTDPSDPSTERTVHWFREPDGAVVAYIAGIREESGGIIVNDIAIIANDPNNPADRLAGFNLFHLDNVGVHSAMVQANAAANNNFEQRTIIDSTGASDFVQIGDISASRNVKIWGPYTLAIPALGAGAGMALTNLTNQPTPTAGSILVGSIFGSIQLAWGWGLAGAFYQIGAFNPAGVASPACTFTGIVITVL